MKFLESFFKPDINKMEAQKNIKGLFKILNDTNNDQRIEAMQALANIGGDVVWAEFAKILVSGEKEFLLLNNAKYYLSTAGTQAINHLKPYLKDDNLNDMVFYTLVQMGRPALEPMRNALCDPDWNVRKNAANIIHQIKDVKQEEWDGVDYWVAAGKFEQLKELGDDAITPLISMLDAPIYNGPAARVLGEIGDLHVAQILIESVKKDHSYIAWYVDIVLGLLSYTRRNPSWSGLIAPILDLKGPSAVQFLEYLLRANPESLTPSERSLLENHLKEIDSTAQLPAAEPQPVKEYSRANQLWKSGHWWSREPQPGEEIRWLTVIGCRKGDEPDGPQVNEAMSSGHIARSSKIYVCDGFTFDQSDNEIVAETLEASRLVAQDCAMELEEYDCSTIKMTSHTYGNSAIVIRYTRK
ncbi:MAG: hypothetical protein GYA12_08850 [Chloroflexi bacterium]|nr:hypothetical protein [Chloroflexota bacterium]